MTRLVLAFIALVSADALSLTPQDGASQASWNTLSDRFRAVCPADARTIKRFHEGLIDDEAPRKEESIWAAVFRSNNNKPSVFVKDDFLHAMRAAVDPVETNLLIDENVQNSFESPESKQDPIAVACLQPSKDFDDCWVLESMRCILKKEQMDETCDGGSEHMEAISAAIDILLLHYLSKAVEEGRRFDGVIRIKATLVSGVLLESRGFAEVESLQKDMATHVSSLDACMEKYAERSVDLNTKSPGARQRALSIVSYLGRLNRKAELQASQTAAGNDEDDFDPWATVKQFL
jgi:hypothetical protein